MNGIINAVRKLLGLTHRGTAKINSAISTFEATITEAAKGVAHLEASILDNAAAKEKAEELYQTAIAKLKSELDTLSAERERGLRFVEKVRELVS